MWVEAFWFSTFIENVQYSREHQHLKQKICPVHVCKGVIIYLWTAKSDFITYSFFSSFTSLFILAHSLFQFHLTMLLVYRPPHSLRLCSRSCCQCVTDRCCILSASLCNCILQVIELSWSPRRALIFTGAPRSSLPPLPFTSSLAPSI